MTRSVKIAHTLVLLAAIATLWTVVSSTDRGDEYTEDGQLVEKTDVRVTGVDFGRTVDADKRLSDTTDEFVPTDHVYASIRTKGSSQKTTLGVRWKNPAGDEINSSNVWIRPTGDTSTVFDFSQQVPWKPGRYTLVARVNGAEVKTASFTIYDGDPPGPITTLKAPPVPSLHRNTSHLFSAIASKVSSGFASLTEKVAVLTGREPRDQSPFEWKGLRAGMRFSKADRLSSPGSPWERTPFLMNVSGFRRYTARQNKDLGWGTLMIIADSTADRVLEVEYSSMLDLKDSTQRLAFEREMVALGDEWDKMPGVIRQQSGQSTGPHSFSWATPDSLWNARISYEGSVTRAPRPEGIEIKELHWDERVMTQFADSMKARRAAQSATAPR